NSAGGAGRTASGLAMLMGNASKVLQVVAANIDRDILHPLLSSLFDMIMLTDTSGLLSGEEDIRIMGVQVAMQRETQRSRQLEFLQITANPLDQQIIGVGGRAKVLRSVAQTIGMDGQDIVPTDDQLAKQEAQQAQQAQSAPINQAVQEGVITGVKMGVNRIATELTSGLLAASAKMPEGPPAHIGTLPDAAAAAQGNQAPGATADMGPRTNLQAAAPKPVAGGVG